jgi:hypothetical protein
MNLRLGYDGSIFTFDGSGQVEKMLEFFSAQGDRPHQTLQEQAAH